MKLWDWLRGAKPVTPQKPALEEMFVTMIRDRYSVYPSKNLTPSRLDQILAQANLGYCRESAELFEEFEEKDPHIYSCLQTRKQAVMGLEWDIITPDESTEAKARTAFIKEILRAIPDFRGSLLDLLDAIGKGYSCEEIIWGVRDDKKIVPIQLNWIHSKNITWLNSLVPRIITEKEQSLGIEPPPWKAIMHLYRAKSGHDTRNGVLRVIAWMYLFKNYTVKDWVTFNEVFGMPLRVGKYDSDATPEDIKKLSNAIKNLGSDAAGVISKKTEVEFIESASRGAGRMNPFQMLVDFANREISKAILGQTLTMDTTGQTGTYSTAKIHEMVRQDILEADAEALGATITDQLIRPIVGFNYPNGWNLPLPRMWIKAEAEENAKDMSEVYVNVVKMRCPIPLSHIYERFGIPAPKDDEATTANLLPMPEAKLPARREILALLGDSRLGDIPLLPGAEERAIKKQIELDHLLEVAIQKNFKVMTEMLAPLKDLINNGHSLEEIKNKLISLYPQLPKRDLRELIYQTMMLAYMKGRIFDGPAS
jgi:phage gp29-like protein